MSFDYDKATAIHKALQTGADIEYPQGTTIQIGGLKCTMSDFLRAVWLMSDLWDETLKELDCVLEMVKGTGLVDTEYLNAVEAVGELVGDDDIVMYRRSEKEKTMQELVELSEELGLYD